MIEIYDDATLAAALATPLDDTCRALIERIVSDARVSELWDLTCIIVVGTNDSEAQLESILGFNPSIGPLGSDEEGKFVPWWSFASRGARYTELLHCVGEFAYYVLVAEDGRSGLAALCREFAGTMES